MLPIRWHHLPVWDTAKHPVCCGHRHRFAAWSPLHLRPSRRGGRTQVFDITGGNLRALPEMTVDLDATFPEPSQTAFSLKNFQLDENEGRLYAASDQVPNSQALVFEYAPASAAADGCLNVTPFTHSDRSLRPEYTRCRSDQPHGGNSRLAHTRQSRAFFVFAAWNGTAAQSMVTMLNADLEFEPTCGEFVTDADLDYNFGCFIGGNPFDDRGACVDATNRVGVVTVPLGVQFSHSMRWAI